jgi:hypothetical protein
MTARKEAAKTRGFPLGFGASVRHFSSWSRIYACREAHNETEVDGDKAMTFCKFTFDDGSIFDGFAHGSTWNGLLALEFAY